MSKWPSIIKAAIAESLDGVHTQCPAIVRSYDPKAKTCTLEASIKIDPEIPILTDIPVQVLGTSRHYLHFPLQEGDTGIVLFSMRDFSGWKISGKASPPNVLTKFGLYGMFIPGLRSDLDALDFTGSSDAVIGTPDACICLGEVVQALAEPNSEEGKEVCKAPVFETWAAALESALDSLAPGSGATLAQARTGIGTTKFKAE